MRHPRLVGSGRMSAEQLHHRVGPQRQQGPCRGWRNRKRCSPERTAWKDGAVHPIRKSSARSNLRLGVPCRRKNRCLLARQEKLSPGNRPPTPNRPH